MSAEVLREAAALMRYENPANDGPTECHCEDDGETFTDHWFDRTICPEPCGSMHDVCVECSLVKGHCAVAIQGRREGSRRDKTWHAVANWLDGMALSMTHPSGGASTLREEKAALAVARAYLGSDA